MAQTLNQIKTLLASFGLHPKKRFGQNFLHDGNQMQKILQAAAIERGDVVLEIGPGTGALTEHLCDRRAHVLGVEIDDDLKPLLTYQLQRWPDVQLVFGDVLASKHVINKAVLCGLRDMCQSSGGNSGGTAGTGGTGGRGYKLIANLPYNVASPLLINLAIGGEDLPVMDSAVVMLQREVATRLSAKPGGKDYGPMGILMSCAYQVTQVGTLSPSCFWPEPKVESAIVQLTRRPKPLCNDIQALSRLVGRLFGQRRKQIGTLLKQSTPAPGSPPGTPGFPGSPGSPLPDGIDPHARPESLTMEQLSQLTYYVEAKG